MTNVSAVRGDVEVALDAVEGVFVSKPVKLGNGDEIYFVGNDLRAERLVALNPVLPDRVRQSEILVEPASFIDYIIQFKASTAICRASLGQNNIVAVLDYHGRAREGGDGAVPQPLTHTVTLKCPFDIDYAKWRSVFDTPLSQGQLGELLEDMVHTIAEPAVSDLQEAIDELRIDRAVRFQSKVNRRNGTVQLTYEEVEGDGDNAGGRVSLPEGIKIVLPVFQGGELVQLDAKLRYSMNKGVVTFKVVVPGLDKIERDQFRRIGEQVRAETNTPVFYTA